MPKTSKTKLDDQKSRNRRKTAPARVFAISAKTLFVQQACSQDFEIQNALVLPTKSARLAKFSIFVFSALGGLGGPEGRISRENEVKHACADGRRKAASTKKWLPPEGFHDKAAPALGFFKPKRLPLGFGEGPPYTIDRIPRGFSVSAAPPGGMRWPECRQYKVFFQGLDVLLAHPKRPSWTAI